LAEKANLFLKMLLSLGNQENRGEECGSILNFLTLKIAFYVQVKDENKDLKLEQKKE